MNPRVAATAGSSAASPTIPRNALFITDSGLISARVFRAWLDQGHRIAALWIGPACERRFVKQRRWVRRLAPSWSVAAQIRRYGIPMRSHPRLSTWASAADEAALTGANVLITCMTFQIVPAAMLQVFGERAFNFHPALLPRYRGPAPRTGMLLDGRAQECSGMTLHRLSPGIDEGDIVGQRAVRLKPRGSFMKWTLDLAEAAAELTANPLQACLSGQVEPRPQDPDCASYRRVARSELTINSTTTADRAQWLAAAFRGTGRVRVEAAGRHYKVENAIRISAAPTRAPALVTTTAVEMNIADSRVQFRRSTRATARWRDIGLLIRIAAKTLPTTFARIHSDVWPRRETKSAEQ